MTKYEIQDRASNKAFAKISMLKIEIDQLSYDIKHKLTGPITMNELELLLSSTEKELQVWQYITESIEKSNK
jgi:hypothetical protein